MKDAKPYVIQRQSQRGADWRAIIYCHTLEYARKVAAIGRDRGLGVAYRAIDLSSGSEVDLLAAPLAQAA